jgi:hypothetical protein
VTLLGVRIDSPADNLRGLELVIYDVGFVTCTLLFVVLCVALCLGAAALVQHVHIGRTAIQEARALRKRNEEYLERVREWREENYKLRDQVARLERERADDRGDYRGETMVDSLGMSEKALLASYNRVSSTDGESKPLEQET